MNNQADKPPIGLRPRYVWVESRVDEILTALVRRREAGLGAKLEWVQELLEHLEFMHKVDSS